MKTTKITNHKIFSETFSQLKQQNKLPDILEYSEMPFSEEEIPSLSDWSFRCAGDLYRGANEGIVVCVHLETHGREDIQLGMFKTLRSSKDAWITMGILLAEFQWTCREVMERLERDKSERRKTLLVNTLFGLCLTDMLSENESRSLHDYACNLTKEAFMAEQLPNSEYMLSLLEEDGRDAMIEDYLEFFPEWVRGDEE